MQDNTCPCCKRRCPLDSPKCRRGIKYRNSCSALCDGDDSCPCKKRKADYSTLSIEEKLYRCLRRLRKKLKPLESQKRQELIDTLSQNEREALLALLERLINNIDSN